MLSCLSGKNFTASIPLTDENGSPITASSVSYGLFDKLDNELIADTPLLSFVTGSPSVSITIPAINNTLQSGSLSDVRLLRLRAATTGGTKVIDTSYVIVPESELGFMINSYQSLQEADLQAFEMPGLDAYQSAVKSNKIAALKEAYRRLGTLTFSVDYNYLGGILNYVTETNTMTSGGPTMSLIGRRTVVVNKLNLLPMTYIQMLPPVFMQKLKLAQTIEANNILSEVSADTDAAKRAKGIILEKVGESTTQWIMSKPLQTSVSRNTLNALKGWIHYGAILSRG